MPTPPDIEAEIRLLCTKEGGRQTPVASGYRPNHDFGLEGTLIDAVHTYIGNERVAPGDTVVAHLTFVSSDMRKYLGGRLHVGFEFTIQEGARMVGRGRITKILNRALTSPEA